jgi:hypothetical protein
MLPSSKICSIVFLVSESVGSEAKQTYAFRDAELLYLQTTIRIV